MDSLTSPVAATIAIPVRTPSAEYSVHLGSGLLRSVGEHLDQLTSGALRSGRQRAIVITSPEILELWGEFLLGGFAQRPLVLTVPSGEAYKRFSVLERLLEELAAAGADRDTILVAFGGGVLGDMTGFLAAIYMRGLRYVQIPTTLLAQVDSSVGGKTGVNLGAGKNLVGAFYHPLAVYADIDTLGTLPPAELRAGLQEAVKAGIIRDRTLFEFLEAEQTAILARQPQALLRVIADSVRMKAEVVAADERESGLRMILNLGHTLGHAIEAATEYKELLHGEAVAWGMLAAVRLALGRKLIGASDAVRVEAVIRAYGPLRPFSAEASRLVLLTAKDKKNRSGLRSFVLPLGIGSATVVHDVGDAELREAAEEIIREAASGRAVSS